MKTTIYFITCVCCLALMLFGCKGKTASGDVETGETLPLVLSLEKIVEAGGEEFLSSIAKDVEYIPLETNEKSLFKQILKIAVLTNGSIVLTDGERLLLFGKDGKFIRPVSQKGSGPADYGRINALATNPVTGGFYLYTIKKVVEFDADGNYVKNFATEDRPMDMVADAQGRVLLHRMNLLKSPEDTATTWFLFRYDATGKEVARFADMSPRMKGEDVISLVMPSRPLYVYNNNVRISEFGNDTIFTVKEDGLYPYAIVDLGYMKMPAVPEGKGNMDAAFIEINKKLNLSTLWEDDTFLYMAFGWGFGGEYLYSTYNKTNKKVTNYGGGEYNYTECGLTNDIDGGMPFYPLMITPEGTRIMWKQADSFKESILKMDYEAQKGKYGGKFEKIWQMAKQMKEDDNPVLIVVR